MSQHDDQPETALGLAFRNGAEHGHSRPNIIEVDFERYHHFLEDSGMSEAQKKEFLAALWSIMLNFVDLGFGIHPAANSRRRY